VSETLEIPVSKFDAHGIGSGITYGRRYGLMSVLCLAAVDDDGNAAVEKAPAAPPKKAEPDAKELVALSKAMVEAAALGTEALKAKWRTLPIDQRTSIDPKSVEEWKEAAAKADASKKEAE
jgi:hypothetical protein